MAETNKTTEEKPKTTRKRTTKAKAETQAAEQNDILQQNEMLKQSNEMLMQKLAEMQEQITRMQNQAPQVVTYAADTERVQFFWEAPVANNNEVDFGPNGLYGRIVGKTGSFSVPKNELSRILTAAVRMYLDRRWLIVVSGLNEEEREALGVNYAKGEILDKKMFRTMVENGEDIVEIFPGLCDEHKEIVAKTFYETWQNSPQMVSREVVMALYKSYKNIALKKIIEGMNAQELED